MNLKEVYIRKDERNAIIIFPDNYKGLVVQVIRFANQLKPNHNNELIEHRVKYSIWSKTISTMSDEMAKELSINPMSPLKIKDGNKFKSEITNAIEEAKSYLSKVESLDNMIDGSMNDYISQNSIINKA